MAQRGFLRRILAVGQSAGLPERESRQVRVTCALALIGIVLSAASLPIDLLGAPATVAIGDITSVVGFAIAVWLLARGKRSTGRVVLLVIANATIAMSVLALHSRPGTRAVFFPLALLPFLVFGLGERIKLAIFAAIPIAAYFLTARPNTPPAWIAADFYEIYAPALAFVVIVSGAIVFVSVEATSEEKLLRARAHAAQTAQLVALGEMASGIAHEIRNPLAAIHLAATEVAARPGQPEQVEQLGQRIQRIVMRASRIIETLRSLARDASADPFVATPASRIVGDTLELCGKRIAEGGVTLTVSPIPEDLTVDCRSVQLSQVLMNLLTNAYDAVAGSPEAWVKVDVTAVDEHLEMVVTDSGQPIPAPLRARIFEPFFTTKPAERGTGLGLSLCATIVSAHHGTIALDGDSPNTRFVVRVPLVQPSVAAASV